MAALDTASAYTYPRSASPNDLYTSLRTLVDQMRRVRAEDYTQAQQLEDVAAEIGADLKAQIESGNLSPDAAFDLMISAISASIFGPATASANAAWAQANALMASRLKTALQSYVQTASLNVEQTIRQSETESLASEITTLTASLGTTNAAITTEATARVNGDSANAALISTVQTQANGNSAAITTVQSSIDGIEARWGVVINLNGQVTGLVQLDGTASGSVFTVVADKFIVAHPSSPATTIAAFVIGLVNGVSTIGINGNLLVDGSILARTIAAGAITTNKLAAGAVTANEIAAGAITAVQLAADSVTATQIAAGAVTATELAAGAVTAGKIAAGSITAAELAADSVTASQIAAGAVTATELAAGAVTAGKIAAGSVTATELYVTSLDAVSAVLGNLTAGTVTSPDGKLFISSVSGLTEIRISS